MVIKHPAGCMAYFQMTTQKRQLTNSFYLWFSLQPSHSKQREPCVWSWGTFERVSKIQRQPSNSSSARIPSEGGTKSSRSSPTFISPCFSLPFYHSLLPFIFFYQSKHLSHTFFLRFQLVFIFYPHFSSSLACFPHLSLPVFFSTTFPPVFTPPLTVSRFLPCTPSLCRFCYPRVSDRCHRILLEAQQTWGRGLWI